VTLPVPLVAVSVMDATPLVIVIEPVDAYPSPATFRNAGRFHH